MIGNYWHTRLIGLSRVRNWWSVSRGPRYLLPSPQIGASVPVVEFIGYAAVMLTIYHFWQSCVLHPAA